VLYKLLIPYLLEGRIKKLLNVLELNMIVAAASWRHMFGVCHRLLKPPLQTAVAHAMSTFKLGAF
jgi:hypothetical protein